MTRVRSLAEQAVGNIWLILAQRFVTLVLLPLAWVFGGSFMELRDRVSKAEGEIVVERGRTSALELSAAALRSDVIAHSIAVARLVAQRESDADISASIREMRGALTAAIASTNSRIDQMMTPPRRMTP